MEIVLPAGQCCRYRSCVLHSASAWWLHQELNCACTVTGQWKMASGVVEPVGCMVGVAATFFDIAGDHFENRWSFGLFGNEWGKARCMGKVIRVTKGGKWCLVQWSIDGTVTRAPASALTLEAPSLLSKPWTHLTYHFCLLSYRIFICMAFLVPLSQRCNYASFLSFFHFFFLV